MTLTNNMRVTVLTVPAILGLLILGYSYCNPGIAGVPNETNIMLGRVFSICVLGGTVTSIFALTSLHAKWEALDQIFKTMFVMLNLCWLVAVIYIVLKMHGLAPHH